MRKTRNFDWLKEVDANALSQVDRDLNKAYNNTFKSGFGFLKFKSKKKNKKSYIIASGIKISNKYFYSAKIGWIKLSSKTTAENQVICIEDLNVKGIAKNHKLAKLISGVSWREFVRQLEYKCE